MLALLAIGGLTLLGLLLGFIAWGAVFGSGDEVRTLRWGGEDRLYRLHKPAGLDASRPAPLVLVLHGGGSNGRQTEFLTLNAWNELAAREGFLVAYPDGVGSRWNDGRADPKPPRTQPRSAAERESSWAVQAPRRSADDVGFISALIDRLASEFNVDRGRVFSTGISNGAMMSFRLGCELSDKIAAIGPVAGAMPEPLMSSCAPSRPVSIVALSGVLDPLVPYAGGEVGIARRSFGKVAPVPDSLRLWARLNGCPSEPATALEPDRDPGDGTRVTRHAWLPCREASEVVLYTIDGGGHTWPGGVQYLPPFIIGRTSRDVDATEVIWEFFKAHGRP
ncbi:MAG: PHB depolymerase family esterase [Halobacteria archaeon]